jgi:HK97 family phage major capsid protein
VPFVAIYDHEGPDSSGDQVRMLGGKTIVDDEHPAVAANPAAWARTAGFSDTIRAVSPGGTKTEVEAQREAVRRAAESGDPAPVEEARRTLGKDIQTPRPSAVRGTDIWDLNTIRANAFDPYAVEGEIKDRALRAVDQSSYPHPGVRKSQAQEHVEHLVRSNPEAARLVLSTGSPLYQRAFSKALLKRPLTADETRALAVSTNAGADGGVAVPFTLDPTVVPTSDGSVNPYRAISRVETISGSNTWQGVSSDGITASYADEAEEATDDSPEFDQPEVKVERATAFVPFSFEVGQDFSNLQGQLAVLVQEAKDDLEADKFTNGAGPGSKEPTGVLTALVADATNVAVDSSADDNTISVADVFAVEADLGARFRSRAAWVAPRSSYTKVRQLDENGGSNLWIRIADPTGAVKISANLAGYPAYEASAFANPDSADDPVAILGDFSRYHLIVDRVGLSLSLIPHLFGDNGRPTGQSGLYAFWRNTATVISTHAFRYLKV